VYSLGMVARHCFCPNTRPQGEFECSLLSPRDVSLVNQCVGPRSGRLSAYHLCLRGMFTPPTEGEGEGEGEGEDRAAKFAELATTLSAELQEMHPQTRPALCTVSTLDECYTLPETPTLKGCIPLAPSDNGDGCVVSLLEALQKPITLPSVITPVPEGERERERERSAEIAMACEGMIQKHPPQAPAALPPKMHREDREVALLEPVGCGQYPVRPSLAACTMLREAGEREDTATVDSITGYYQALGRALAICLISSPIPYGVLDRTMLTVL
ncbi:hypothetical protein KIPB_014272, partial [Kipferlia bialata]